MDAQVLLPFDINPDELPRFIAIEGPIGVGKTTLAKRIANVFNYQPLLEEADENPFLGDFYQNQRRNALATQLFFLFKRSEQLQNLRQADIFEPSHVADYIIEKDRLFARSILNEDEFSLYDQVYNLSAVEAPSPDLVIYLQAPTPVLMQRIHDRGVKAERHIQADYLETINQAYSEFFHYYDAAPLLIINAAQIDLINDDDAFINLLQYMLTIKNGRHYFNPSFFNEVHS
ncbi:Deoxyguanosine kinase [BD1-7 clade bacterium]|uniref:Deoxyguanosine kinase n=1 Tax=BD1-7 clade bacterium TaxID=2029982 RepID=A0A5S9MX48_9GAMM|nr:Deoxyguanosine kinase [BD1-7 clade bacterium]